jgi:hypothetical protein
MVEATTNQTQVSVVVQDNQPPKIKIKVINQTNLKTMWPHYSEEAVVLEI